MKKEHISLEEAIQLPIGKKIEGITDQGNVFQDYVNRVFIFGEDNEVLAEYKVLDEIPKINISKVKNVGIELRHNDHFNMTYENIVHCEKIPEEVEIDMIAGLPTEVLNSLVDDNLMNLDLESFKIYLMTGVNYANRDYFQNKKEFNILSKQLENDLVTDFSEDILSDGKELINTLERVEQTMSLAQKNKRSFEKELSVINHLQKNYSAKTYKDCVELFANREINIDQVMFWEIKGYITSQEIYDMMEEGYSELCSEDIPPSVNRPERLEKILDMEIGTIVDFAPDWENNFKESEDCITSFAQDQDLFTEELIIKTIYCFNEEGNLIHTCKGVGNKPDINKENVYGATLEFKNFIGSFIYTTFVPRDETKNYLFNTSNLDIIKEEPEDYFMSQDLLTAAIPGNNMKNIDLDTYSTILKFQINEQEINIYIIEEECKGSVTNIKKLRNDFFTKENQQEYNEKTPHVTKRIIKENNRIIYFNKTMFFGSDEFHENAEEYQESIYNEKIELYEKNIEALENQIKFFKEIKKWNVKTYIEARDLFSKGKLKKEVIVEYFESGYLKNEDFYLAVKKGYPGLLD